MDHIQEKRLVGHSGNIGYIGSASYRNGTPFAYRPRCETYTLTIGFDPVDPRTRKELEKPDSRHAIAGSNIDDDFRFSDKSSKFREHGIEDDLEAGKEPW